MSFLRYPAYKDSGVEWLGEVPEHWSITSLKRRARLIYGDALAAEAREEGEVPVYGSNGVVGYHSVANAAAPLIVVGRKGSHGKLAWSDTTGFVIDTAYGIDARVCEEHLRWLFYALHPMQLSAVSQDTGVPGLAREAAYALPVATPPLMEQIDIATFLDRETAKIDALMADYRTLIELLQEKRQAVISHAVTKGLDPTVPMKDSGVEWLGEVPEHWGVKKLRHIAKIVRGASPRPAGDPKFFSPENFDGDNSPWVTVAEITKDRSPYLTEVSEYLTPLGVTLSQFFESGTLIFTNSGATLGVPKILAVNCCANDGVLILKDLPHEIEILFAYYFLLTTTERLRTEMKQGGGQPNLNTDIVKNIGFAVPPISEQSTIVYFLDRETAALDSLITDAEEAITLLHERRTALISAAVTGKIDVRPLVQQTEEAA